MSFGNRHNYAKLAFEPLILPGVPIYGSGPGPDDASSLYKLRIEQIARTYLNGVLPIIQTAELYGPFEKKWQNPWKTATIHADTPALDSVASRQPSLKRACAYVSHDTDCTKNDRVTFNSADAKMAIQIQSQSREKKRKISVKQRPKKASKSEGKTPISLKPHAGHEIAMAINPPQEDCLGASTPFHANINVDFDEAFASKVGPHTRSLRPTSYLHHVEEPSCTPAINSTSKRSSSWDPPRTTGLYHLDRNTVSSPVELRSLHPLEKQNIEGVSSKGFVRDERCGKEAVGNSSCPNSPERNQTFKSKIRTDGSDTSFEYRTLVNQIVRVSTAGAQLDEKESPVSRTMKKPRLVTFSTPEKEQRTYRYNRKLRSRVIEIEASESNVGNTGLVSQTYMPTKPPRLSSEQHSNSIVDVATAPVDAGVNNADVDIRDSDAEGASLCASTQTALQQAIQAFQEGLASPEPGQAGTNYNKTPLHKLHSSLDDPIRSDDCLKTNIDTQELWEARPNFTMSTVKRPATTVRSSSPPSPLALVKHNNGETFPVEGGILQSVLEADMSEFGKDSAESPALPTPWQNTASFTTGAEANLQAGQGQGYFDQVNVSFVIDRATSFLGGWKPDEQSSGSQVSVAG